jgi:hypothetical protein
MRAYLRERPWIWIVLLLGLFASANVAVFVAAQASHGPDLLETR